MQAKAAARQPPQVSSDLQVEQFSPVMFSLFLSWFNRALLSQISLKGFLRIDPAGIGRVTHGAIPPL